MKINNNLNAMNAHRNMYSANSIQGKSMEKLNSGKRINKAADDAAGLAISEAMKSQVNGLNQASKNAQDGISMIQTAEGALSRTHEIAQRMKELAVQSANGIYSDSDRKIMNKEFNQLKKEMDRIAKDTQFNGSSLISGEKSGKTFKTTEKSKNDQNAGKLTDLLKDSVSKEEVSKLGEGEFKLKVSTNGSNELTLELLDNSKFNGGKEYTMDKITIKDPKQLTGNNSKVKLAGIEFDLKDAAKNVEAGKSAEYTFTNEVDKTEDGVSLQVSANDGRIGFSIDNMNSRELGLGGIEIGSLEDAQEAIGRIDEAISRVSSQRSDLGSSQNRLEHTITSTNNTAQNLQASESRISDTDMAKEIMFLTKINIMKQASQAMMLQANQQSSHVLSILK